MIQHSPDLRFQKDCLEKMKNAVAGKEINKREIAYLTDRILVKENKRQLFGTQFHIIKNKFKPFPIQGVANLGKRRKEYELEPFKSYAKKFENKDVSHYKNLFKKQ